MLSLIFFVLALVSFSQNEEIDSLKIVLETESNGEQQILTRIAISQVFRAIDIDSSVIYAKEGYSSAYMMNYEIGIAKSAAELGSYYITKNNLDSAKRYYAIARNTYQKIDSLFSFTQNTMRLGNINLAQNNYIEAIKLYQECLDIATENSYQTLIPHLHNNMGLLYKQIEDYDDAQTNFEKAYNLFKEQSDEANSVYPLYNRALVQSIIGHDNEAINGYLDLVGYHLKTENWVSLASVYNSISMIYLKNQEYDKAKEYLEMALNAVRDKKDSFNTGPSSFYTASIYSNAAEIFAIENEFTKAKTYAHKAIKIALNNSYKLDLFKSAKILGEIHDIENQIDSSLYYHKMYIQYNDVYQDEYDVKQLTKLKMQNEFDEILRQNEIERIYKEAEYKNKELKYMSAIVATILTAIILILLFFNQKNKTAKLKLKEENLLLEKRKLNQDLEYKKKELVSNLMYLLEKNEFIISISKKLIELKPDAKKDNKELIQQIINEIRQNSSNKIWAEFEFRFKEVHTEFYKKLYGSHPNLTPNEVKICAFLRLNMSTKEISAITHQSVKSINMARFRLRKKLDIERDENLITYLNSL